MKQFFLFLALAATLYSCKKECPINEFEVTGVVKDYTGKLDGCGIMIELSNGRKLEIASLPPGTALIIGRTVAIKYNPAPDRVSICMAGDIVHISSLRYL